MPVKALAGVALGFLRILYGVHFAVGLSAHLPGMCSASTRFHENFD